MKIPEHLDKTIGLVVGQIAELQSLLKQLQKLKQTLGENVPQGTCRAKRGEDVEGKPGQV